MASRPSHPTELSDAEWQILAPLIPSAKLGGRPEQYPKCAMVNASWYVWRTGCAWRSVPNDLPHWDIVYHYHRQWRRDGTWKRTNEMLRGNLRVLESCNRQPSAAMIDSQSIQITDRGGDRGFDADKLVKGRRRHILVAR